MMYVVYNKDHIHHLLNESKKWKVSYIWDQREYYVFAQNHNNFSMFIFFKVTYIISLKIKSIIYVGISSKTQKLVSNMVVLANSKFSM